VDPCNEYRFDGWRLIRPSGELAKAGRRIRLQSQPLQILESLLAQPGELVTRETLIARLWPNGVVDYDTALNSAVRRLRGALGDCADAPRYIETIPRRGYRFIGAVELQAAPVDAGPAGEIAATRAAGVRAPRWLAAATILLALTTVAAVASSLAGVFRLRPVAAVFAPDGRAYERHERARHLLDQRTHEDVERARQYFEEAVAIDPAFAGAWAGLASAYWIETVEGWMPAAQALPRVRDAAERALALDPQLAEAHVRLAMYQRRTGNLAGSAEHLGKASALEPDDPLVLSLSASSAAEEGQLDAAVELQRRAVERKPLSAVHRRNLVAMLTMAGRLQEAQVELQRLRELNPANRELAIQLAQLLVLEGRFDEALDLAAQIAGEAERQFIRTVAYHGLDRKVESDAALQALIRSLPGDEGLQIAEALAYRGERDQAFEWLWATRDAYRDDLWVEYSPFLQSLRTDARWSAWLAPVDDRRSRPQRRPATG
jgi:DNA-binding winged helix-turn-helix (wHTH) protein/thioredoxin-like negative regulator of GroEL